MKIRSNKSNIKTSKESSVLSEPKDLIEYYKQIFNSAKDAIFIHDAKTGDIIDFNHTALDMFGYTLDEYYNSNPHDLTANILGFTFEQVQSKVREASMGETKPFKWLSKRKNGVTFWTEVSINPFKIGNSEMAVALVRDIDEKERISIELTENEQLLQNIFNCFTDGISVLDTDMNILKINNVMEEMYKHAMPLVGKKCYHAYHEKESPCTVCPTIHTLKTGEPHTAIVNYHTNEGNIGWIELSTYPMFDSNKKISGIVEHVKDITKRTFVEMNLKESEEKYRLLIEGQTDLVIKVDTNGRFLFVSPSYCQLYGKTEMELIGKNFIPLIHEDDRQQAPGMMESLKKTPHTAYLEQRVNASNGLRWLAWSYKAVLDTNGEIKEVIGVGRDVTEKKKFEEDLQNAKQSLELQNKELTKAKEDAEKSDKLKTAFIANMSHEIRTPMNAILGFSSMLNDEDSTGEDKDMYVNIIQTKGQDLLNLINDIIDTASIEAGELKLDPYPFNLNELLNELNFTFTDLLKLKGKSNAIELKIFKASSLDEHKIVIDHNRVKQVLGNLLSNAIKFTEKGSIELTCEVINKNTLKFTVKDTGIGIPNDKLDVIFDRFRQVNEDGIKSPGGTGLGLSIAKQLTELMNGKIWVESNYQSGSTFYFTLPFMYAEKNDLVIKKTPRKIVKLKDKTVLVAEDDSTNLIFIKSMIE
ncbi:MAG: PAS domain S-box protein, partial [Bacteroidales bacterium]|nr:PAS domain S-box protein [Bacteroidales bacterium]